ncbi:MAG: hypothetical protein D3909_17540, partial [Candidatus Electrothrix sp. ATG1]|nr:hypothetical protein [Candidatus Electrothrix sp. ATG1]
MNAMTTSKNTVSDRIAEYSALAPTQKAIVRILAVNVDHCRAKRMHNCLEELGVTCPETNAPYNVRTIQPLQNELVEKGLLLKSNKGLCCPESIRQTAVRDCLAEDQFSRIAQAVQNNVLFGAAPHKVVLNSYKQYARSMQMALFSTSSIREIYSIFDNGDKFFSDTPPEKDIFRHILAQPFSPAVIEKIHPEIRRSVLGY